VFVKVCGITRPSDASVAAAAGADAIGLDFVSTSARCIDLVTARRVLAETPDDVMTVGVFRDHRAAEVLEIVDALGLAAAQLHGDEPPDVTAAVGAGVGTVIKVVVPGRRSFETVAEQPADIVMFDAESSGGGVPFDWDLIGDFATSRPVLLAGGLRPDNVREAIRRVRPWGVDVASGVEHSPGRKDRDAIVRFIAEARSRRA
jgi:phosphoribosylanthranilate isomerase